MNNNPTHSIKNLEERISKLKKLADEAYKKRDFSSENQYDAERVRLQKLLDKLQLVVPLTEKDLLPHKWVQSDIERYGDARCLRCAMKFSYFKDDMAKLSEWSDKEKKTSSFNENMKRYSCIKSTADGMVKK